MKIEKLVPTGFASDPIDERVTCTNDGTVRGLSLILSVTLWSGDPSFCDESAELRFFESEQFSVVGVLHNEADRGVNQLR